MKSSSNAKRQDTDGSLLRVQLKLPNVNSDRNSINLNGKKVDLDIQSRSSADEDEEEVLCIQPLKINKTKLSSELHNLYEVLQQLPTFNLPPPYRNRICASNTSRERTSHWVASTSSSTNTSIREHQSLSHIAQLVGTRQHSLSPSNLSMSSSHPDLNILSEDETFEGQRPGRELVKMHHINLYESILPHSLLPSFRNRKR